MLDDLKKRLRESEAELPSLLGAALAGRYTILRQIGRGGMALVFLADDLRHRREVAVKVVRPELALGVGASRFVREIAIAARLQHPHILPLFESGEANGLLYYVMPYIPGESLRARLAREHQLPVADAVRIASEVADALDHAHRHGVLHRDIKPENILLDEGGHAVVADFGIARALARSDDDVITSTGMAVGTPAYMSPEQAEGGHDVDGRSDVYALGCVLYEMLAGEPPHTGPTSRVVMAKLLAGHVASVREVRELVPAHVDAALLRALARTPADRFGTASAFAKALALPAPVAAPEVAIPDEMPADPRPRHVRPEGLRRLLPWAIAVALVPPVAMVALRATRDEPLLPLWRVNLDLEDVLLDTEPIQPDLAIGPDGRHLAVIGSLRGARGIVVRDMADGTLSLVPGSADARWVTFSPRGDWLLFAENERLLKAPIRGASAVVLMSGWVGRATWTDRDEIIFPKGGAIVRLSADGGSVDTIARVDTVMRDAGLPSIHALPGGDAMLFTIRASSDASVPEQLAVLTVADGTVTRLGIAGSNPHFVDGGLLVYGTAGGSVHAARFSLRGRRIMGTPQEMPGVAGARRFSVSRGGHMAFLQSTAWRDRRLVTVDRAGKRRPLAPEPDAYQNLRISPDGRRLALEAAGHIWVYDVAAGTRSLLTAEGSPRRPEWTADGQRIAYSAIAGDGPRRVILAQRWDRSAGAEVLVQDDASLWEISLGQRGGYLAVQRDADAGTGEDVLVAPVDSPSALRPLAASRVSERGGRVSPDGRHVAYSSAETGRFEVYVQQVAKAGARLLVSSGGGEHPVWSHDGRELFYRVPGYLMAARLRLAPELVVERRDTLFASNAHQPDVARASYDVWPDGRGFVMIEAAVPAGTDSIIAIANWGAHVRRALGAAARW